ncbi:MAG: glycosyltransferase family 2 protein [Planctomycetes bacterium]|jgi:glycosyltransferase involved in cell wall biosynthesis|nr:glycosyltransferase family 2 protein [Planctomycetota bacterium]
MSETKKIFCVIPAYNENITIARVVSEVFSYVDRVVVVDDASTDDTGRRAKESGAIVLRHIVNRDQGAALMTGNIYALNQGADIIVHFDADGQFIASEIPELIQPLQNGGYDAVFGSRFLGKRSDLPFLKKHLFFPVARLINRLFFKVKTSDPQSGFRALSRSAAERIVIEQDGKAHCTEIMAKTSQYRLRFKEVPITVIYHDFGQKFSGGIRIIKDFFIKSLLK